MKYFATASLIFLVSACSAWELTDKLRRRLFAEDEIDSLSFLAFGTSDTWGAGIIGEEDPTSLAFPALMGSSRVKNLGIRASGPGYPAVCLETMLGNDSYQVILIEYMLRADEGLEQLARRLRHRFPNAVIIFLDIWYPRMIRVANSGINPELKSIGLESYMKHSGYQSVTDQTFIEHLKHFPENKMFMKHRVDLQEVQRKIVHEVGGYIWQMPHPKEDNQLALHLSQLAHYYSSDNKHLSKEGHEFVAHGLRRLLRSIPAGKISTATNPWSQHDSCSTWFLSGDVPHSYGTRVKLAMFDEESKKYALEVDPRGGSLVLRNPFPDPATLYLSFMATGPPKKYPNTTATVGEQQTILEPVIEGPFHLAITAKVGILQPGDNAVTLQAAEQSEWNFRLVATSITQVPLLADDLGLVNLQAMAEQENDPLLH